MSKHALATLENAPPARSRAASVFAELAANPRLSESVAQRFWRYVDKSGGPEACWPWISSKGYYGGFKAFSYRTVMSHRAAFFFGHGADPGDMYVCHRCDNPPCCNPDHLFLGTALDNNRDARRKGRAAIGERSCKAKLTLSEVVEIRQLISQGRKDAEIADRFGVTYQNVWMIRHGKTWR